MLFVESVFQQNILALQLEHGNKTEQLSLD